MLSVTTQTDDVDRQTLESLAHIKCAKTFKFGLVVVSARTTPSESSASTWKRVDLQEGWRAVLTSNRQLMMCLGIKMEESGDRNRQRALAPSKLRAYTECAVHD